MGTIDVLARANLTLEGGIRLDVGDVLTIPDTPEARACIEQQLLVLRAEDGGFPDLGPLGRPTSPPPSGCCGRR